MGVTLADLYLARLRALTPKYQYDSTRALLVLEIGRGNGEGWPGLSPDLVRLVGAWVR